MEEGPTEATNIIDDLEAKLAAIIEVLEQVLIEHDHLELDIETILPWSMNSAVREARKTLYRQTRRL
jgi:DNA-directed RNA polymerase beta' subunit